MATNNEAELEKLIRSAREEPCMELKVQPSYIEFELQRRKKKVKKRAAIFVIAPASILLFGFGGQFTASQLINLSVQTGHVGYAVTPSQYQHITKGNPNLESAYSVLGGWLQSQQSSNPDYWNTAPFKSYKILNMSLSNSTHAVADIEILLQNSQWSKRTVPMHKANGKWSVAIKKYGEPKGPRYGRVLF